MIRIKNLTVKNFMSVGNVSQAIDFDQGHLTLVLGENLDLGGDGSGHRNGAGKCCFSNTIIRLRNTISGEIYETTVGELYATAAKSQTQPR